MLWQHGRYIGLDAGRWMHLFGHHDGGCSSTRRRQRRSGLLCNITAQLCKLSFDHQQMAKKIIGDLLPSRCVSRLWVTC